MIGRLHLSRQVSVNGLQPAAIADGFGVLYLTLPVNCQAGMILDTDGVTKRAALID